ncbi:MAG: VOC family protein [Thermoleophilia bacterium]|nr:VOC family protein [Thermoleophilia bacterium]
MAAPGVSRAGAILAVADVDRSLAFYRDSLGFSVEATFDDPPYAILSLAGTRLSLAEQGHSPPDHDVVLHAPAEPGRAAAMLVLEVADAAAAYTALEAVGADFVAPLYSPPWGGHRFFVRDPDGHLVELEEPA